MKRLILIGLLLSISCVCIPQEKHLTALQILKKVDALIYKPKDLTLKIKLILIDQDGKEQKIRLLQMLQKGTDKRLIKFLSPPSHEDIGFLSVGKDIMYLYLPAFKKTRRIAPHIKHTKFLDTDFTYEDMEPKRYSQNYIPKVLKEDENLILLELKPKEGVKSGYSKLIMWIKKDNFYPTKIEFYDKTNNLSKVMVKEKIKKIGDYWISEELEMQDLKTGHKTKMILIDVKFDTGLSDEIFTERYLSR